MESLYFSVSVSLSLSLSPRLESRDPSDCETPALEIRRMWSIPSLSLLQSSHKSRVVAPDWVLSMGHIEQTMCKQMTDDKLWLLHSNILNHLTVCQKEFRLVYECYPHYVFKIIYIIYIYMYKQDLALKKPTMVDMP